MKRLPKGVNLGAFMPINSLMIYVMGYEAAKSRRPNDAEKAEMKHLFIESLDHGAVGFALSHLSEFNSHKDCDGSPMPTDAMNVEDIYPLAEVLRERGYGTIQFLAELPLYVANRAEDEALARISERPVVHNVITPFDTLADYHRGILDWLTDCHARGLKIYSQALCMRVWNEFTMDDYNAWQSVDFFLKLSTAGDIAAKLSLVRDSAYRQWARESYDPKRMEGAGGAVDTFILLRTNMAGPWERFNGLLFAQIAAELGKPAIDCFFDVIDQSDGRAEFRTTDATSSDPQKIFEVLSHPYTLCGTSDGGAHIKFYSGGQYATDNIMQMVKETGRMTLEQMHFKLSALPATVFGFEERGTLKIGNWADIYIYDLERLNYNQDHFDITHDLPGGDSRRVVRAEGIDWCIVNGVVTMRNGESVGATPGLMIGNSPVGTRALSGAFLEAAE